MFGLNREWRLSLQRVLSASIAATLLAWASSLFASRQGKMLSLLVWLALRGTQSIYPMLRTSSLAWMLLSQQMMGKSSLVCFALTHKWSWLTSKMGASYTMCSGSCYTRGSFDISSIWKVCYLFYFIPTDGVQAKFFSCFCYLIFHDSRFQLKKEVKSQYSLWR